MFLPASGNKPQGKYQALKRIKFVIGQLNIYGSSSTNNVHVNEECHFSTGGSACRRGNMQYREHKSISEKIYSMGHSDMQGQQ
jgi:hypothetical protein